MSATKIYEYYLIQNKIEFLTVLNRQNDVLDDESKKAIIHFLMVYDSLTDVIRGL